MVTAMQENALHGWRLPDGQHMRMSGYPAKTTSMSFSKGGKWLASSGSDAMVLWPFFGGGPMGKAPIELAGGDGINCTQVACHPKDELVAGGFEDGLVVVADIGSSRILPVAPPGHGPVTTLAWSADGTRLAIGTENGFAAIVDFARTANLNRRRMSGGRHAVTDDCHAETWSRHVPDDRRRLPGGGGERSGDSATGTSTPARCMPMRTRSAPASPRRAFRGRKFS